MRITRRRRAVSVATMVALLATVMFYPGFFQRDEGRLRAQATPTGIKLTWNAPTPTPQSYNVKRSTSSGTEVTIATVSGTTLTYQDNSVTLGQTYWYVVTAVNNAYTTPESLPSNEVSQPFLLPGRSPAPSGLAAAVN